MRSIRWFSHRPKPGDAGKLGDIAEPRWFKAGEDTSTLHGVGIPSRGSAAERPQGRGPFNLAGVGSLRAATHGAGADQHRVSEEVSEREKLNHERPEPSWRQGLAGEFDRRRSRTGNAGRRRVEGSFWFLPLESVPTGTATALMRKRQTCDDRSAGSHRLPA